ncbi:carboxypeptidase M32 [Terribacillus sp. DMT04]|uniref:carboxypeptidase M32 n=1 Tax=Terribacillus sp. DMT04 TaxID=2850441 RepID=UPI001C2CADEA|nr:carboxypeptidase M32 [Terribacillus sp. DMT04]QXE00228.1 carboxypeptidase M32 [Terribacillus sp. DMT04]
MSDATQQYWDLIQEQKAYEEAIALMHWDLRTKAPKAGMEQRAEAIGYLSQQAHRLSTSDRLKELIDELKPSATDDILVKSLAESEKEYDRNKKIPEAEHKAYIMLQSKAESVWGEAREKGDFSLLQPYLEELVAYKKKFASYWNPNQHAYDVLLDLYEPGITMKKLDEVFPALRKSLTQLLEQIKQSPVKPDVSVLETHFSKEQQKAFTVAVLKKMGYDFDAGRLDDTIHPFEITLNSNDVRITTRYDEEDFRMAVFGTIHEGGHALYEQNISDKLAATPLAGGTSMGIHESQSLFWENFVARSEAFWKGHFEEFKTYAPASLQEIDFAAFYQAVNEVKASYIRIEADELTYALHIMIRYELEKALFKDEITVAELPEIWNKKMKEYLGIVPESDAQGVLQDIHWSGGDFGYFPSYALGYMYAAQFNKKMRESLDTDSLIEAGDFAPIKQWLTEQIHQYGKAKKPLELLQDVTGEGLNADYLVTYLTEKYSKIYQL